MLARVSGSLAKVSGYTNALVPAAGES